MKKKWYKHEKFPLIPILRIKQEDMYNTKGFIFKWLFLNIWTLDSPSIELGFVMESHFGLGFVGRLPYLRWTLTIPCPVSVERFVMRMLWRKSQADRYSGL